MLPYLLVLFVCCVWAGLEKINLKRNALWVPCCILVSFAAMRAYYIGTDAPIYTLPFRISNVTHGFEYDPNIEYGYQFVVNCLLQLVDDYSWYFAVVAMIVVFPVLLFMRKYSTNYVLSLFIYITFGFYTALFNPVRQMIAVSICVFAIKYLLEKKIVKYFIIIALASTFHISAWVMLPMYFVCHVNVKLEIKLLSAFLISLIGSSFIINILVESNDRYSNYTSAMTKNGSGLYTVAFYVIIASFIYLFGGQERKVNKDYNCFEQLLLCGVMALIPIAALSTDPSGPQRIITYFIFYVVVLIPVILKRFNNAFIYLIFGILSVIYFMLTTFLFGSIYPYELNEVFRIF